jgi:hypothetical protein
MNYLNNLALFEKSHKGIAWLLRRQKVNSLPLKINPFETQKKADVVYVDGLTRIDSQMQRWLKASKKHKLVFLEKHLGRIKTFLKCTPFSILKNSQIEIVHLQNKWDPSFIFAQGQKTPFVLSKSAVLRHFIYSNTFLFLATLHEYLDPKKGYKNIYSNLGHLKDIYAIRSLKGTLKNKPAILFGSGPTLEQGLTELKGFAKKVFFVGGGSSMKIVHRLCPLDFGIVVDPTQEQKKVFKGHGCKNVPIFFNLRSQSEVVQSFDKRILMHHLNAEGIENFFEDQLGLQSFMENRENRTVYSSVTCIGLELLHFLGCSPIILCGVDLAFVKDRYYASGLKRSARFLEDEVVEFHGIKTTHKWLEEKKALEHRLKAFKNKAVFRLDPQLPIKGARKITIAQLKKWLEKDIVKQWPKKVLFLEKKGKEVKSIVKKELKKTSNDLEQKGSTHPLFLTVAMQTNPLYLPLFEKALQVYSFLYGDKWSEDQKKAILKFLVKEHLKLL